MTASPVLGPAGVPSGVPRARQMLALAGWAARAWAEYDAVSVRRIVTAVAAQAESQAERYASWAVRETGFGVVEDKVIKNRLSSRGLVERYLDQTDEDYVSPRTAAAGRMVLPQPVGVLVVATPSTSPVSSVYRTVLLALLTRNAVVLSPDPRAKGCSGDAARALARAAVAAGAPDGVIQVVDDPSDAVWRALIEDERTGLVLGGVDSGGVDSGGVDPGGSGPVLVDASADLAAAAQTLVASKAFDNSLVGTSESVLIVLEPVADELLAAMRRAGAHLLSPQQCDLVRQNAFPGSSFDPCLLGQDAATIAATAGIEVPPGTRVLLAPFELAVPEEPLASAPPGPLLGVVRVSDLARGIRAASAVLRLRGRGASGRTGGCAVIHSRQPRTVLAYAAALRVARVVVNQGGSLVGAGLEPERLVTWTTIGPTSDLGLPGTGFDGLGPGQPPVGPVPGYPWASNLEAREGRESTL